MLPLFQTAGISPPVYIVKGCTAFMLSVAAVPFNVRERTVLLFFYSSSVGSLKSRSMSSIEGSEERMSLGNKLPSS